MEDHRWRSELDTAHRLATFAGHRFTGDRPLESPDYLRRHRRRELQRRQWTNLNATLAITQFYPGLSIHPTNRDIAFGGTQDNGTEVYSGTLQWGNPNACGDGGWTAIDPATPANVYTTCQLIDIEKSTTGGANNSFAQVISGINGADRVLFIPPLAMDPSNPLTLYFGTFQLYQTTNGAGSWTAMAGGADLTGAGGTGKISAIAVAPSDHNTVYVGANNGTVSVSTNAGAGAAAVFNTRFTGLPPTRMVTNIAVDPTNANTAYAAFSGFSGTNPILLTISAMFSRPSMRADPGRTSAAIFPIFPPTISLLILTSPTRSMSPPTSGSFKL